MIVTIANMNKKQLIDKIIELNTVYTDESRPHMWILGRKDKLMDKDHNQDYHRCIGAITALNNIYNFLLETND